MNAVRVSDRHSEFRSRHSERLWSCSRRDCYTRTSGPDLPLSLSLARAPLGEPW
jgi:hypothetical protein